MRFPRGCQMAGWQCGECVATNREGCRPDGEAVRRGKIVLGESCRQAYTPPPLPGSRSRVRWGWPSHSDRDFGPSGRQENRRRDRECREGVATVPQQGGYRVDKLLIAGVETVVGGNLAAWLSSRWQVAGVAWEQAVQVAECAIVKGEPSGSRPIEVRESEKPDWVVFCGPSAESSWESASGGFAAGRWTELAAAWAKAARDWRVPFTLISSDAVFTGPWMFHRENGTCFCDSPRGVGYRQMEQGVLEANPGALVVRTQAFGWSPVVGREGLPERVVGKLATGEVVRLDCQRHATPILATDLAEILEVAWRKSLTGVYHVGGGERVSPFRFGCLLADQFGLAMSGLAADVSPGSAGREFGSVETSLQSRKIRKALELPLPLIREGLARLHEQHVSGYRERFQGELTTPEMARAA